MTLSIAIVGAGTAGLAAACFLRDGGHEPMMFERFETPKPVGAGLLIQPTGLAVLERLGLRDQALVLGSRIERLHGRAAPGPVIFDLRYDALLPGLHGVAMHRASLFHLLRGAVASRRIAVEHAADIVACDATSGRPRLLDAGGRRFGPFDLVVDASGARSVLRRSLGAIPTRPFRHGAVWGIARHSGFARDALQQRYRSASSMVGVLPVGRLPDDPTPLDAFFWSMPVDALDAWNATDLAGWREKVSEIWPETAALTAQFVHAGDLTQARYAHSTVRRPWRDRLVLIGDAAHQTSPQLGQGANMALLDAAHLADALALHGEIEEALSAYARRRRAHIRFYQAASGMLTQFFQSDSRMAGAIRDAAFGPMSKVPWLRREMIRTLAGLKTGPLTHRDARDLAGSGIFQKS